MVIDLPDIVIPNELKKILEMKEKVPDSGMTVKEKKYLSIIQNLFSKKKLAWPKFDHLHILEILILIEHFYNTEEMKKYSLKNQKPKFNKENHYFEIEAPDMDETNPFVTNHDYVLLNKHVLKIIKVKSGLIIAESYNE